MMPAEVTGRSRLVLEFDRTDAVCESPIDQRSIVVPNEVQRRLKRGKSCVHAPLSRRIPYLATRHG